MKIDYGQSGLPGELEEAGYTVVLQTWNFRAGSNFILEIDKTSRTAQRTIAVLSPSYLDSLYDSPEWAFAFLQDPKGRLRTLLPVRVRECQPQGLLASISYIDLVGLNESRSRSKLLEGVGSSKHSKIATPLAFPGRVRHILPKQPIFPGVPTLIESLDHPAVFPVIWNIPHRRNPYFTGCEDVLGNLFANRLVIQQQSRKYKE